jgi:hypothetical protein
MWPANILLSWFGPGAQRGVHYCSTHTHTHTLQLYDKTQTGKFASVAILLPAAYSCRFLLVLYWQRTERRLHVGKGAKVGRQLAGSQNQRSGRRWPQMALQKNRISSDFITGCLSTASAVPPQHGLPFANTLRTILRINTDYNHKKN